MIDGCSFFVFVYHDELFGFLEDIQQGEKLDIFLDWRIYGWLDGCMTVYIVVLSVFAVNTRS